MNFRNIKSIEELLKMAGDYVEEINPDKEEKEPDPNEENNPNTDDENESRGNGSTGEGTTVYQSGGNTGGAPGGGGKGYTGGDPYKYRQTQNQQTTNKYPNMTARDILKQKQQGR